MSIPSTCLSLVGMFLEWLPIFLVYQKFPKNTDDHYKGSKYQGGLLAQIVKDWKEARTYFILITFGVFLQGVAIFV